MTDQTWRWFHRKVDEPCATFCQQCRESWPCDVWQAMTMEENDQ